MRFFFLYTDFSSLFLFIYFFLARERYWRKCAYPFFSFFLSLSNARNFMKRCRCVVNFHLYPSFYFCTRSVQHIFFLWLVLLISLIFFFLLLRGDTLRKEKKNTFARFPIGRIFMCFFLFPLFPLFFSHFLNIFLAHTLPPFVKSVFNISFLPF